MRLSVVVAGDGAPANAFVVFRGYERSIEKAARLGFHGVEIALGKAEDVDKALVDKVLARRGITVSCISTGLTFAKYGLYMTHPNPTVRAETVAVFHGLIRLAAEWGGMINIGRSRGFIGEGQARAEAESLFAECIDKIAPYAHSHGVCLLLEPINRYESNFLNSLDDAAEMIESLPHKNIGIMADVFHMNIEDDHIVGSLLRNFSHVKYIHIADSNRLAPGWGHTDFASIAMILRQMCYQGWLCAEILPGADPDASAQQAATYMQCLFGG